MMIFFKSLKLVKYMKVSTKAKCAISRFDCINYVFEYSLKYYDDKISMV